LYFDDRWSCNRFPQQIVVNMDKMKTFHNMSRYIHFMILSLLQQHVKAQPLGPEELKDSISFSLLQNLLLDGAHKTYGIGGPPQSKKA
jgi:hypothetical protein